MRNQLEATAAAQAAATDTAAEVDREQVRDVARAIAEQHPEAIAAIVEAVTGTPPGEAIKDAT